MLQLLLGRAGSGKTTALFQGLEEAVHAGRRAILLVPEQFSFESEKELYRRLGPAGSGGVEVLSFTRLCNSIFRRYGGLAAPPLTDTARYILMSMALGELEGELTLYRTQLGNTAFVERMVEAVGEFKAAGVGPEALVSFSHTREGALSEKTRELGRIYQVYQALIDAGYSDPQDDITRALERLEPDFFAGVEVFVDGFVAFMAGEYRLLGRMMAGAHRVTVALCCDSLHDGEEGLGVFSPAKETARRLRTLAGENRLPVAAPHILPTNHRFTTPGLTAVEEGFLQPGPRPAQSGEGVTLVAARDPYDELEYLAADIRRLVGEQGWRYSDFAIICRSLEGYTTPALRVLGRYGIPCFLDLRRDAQNTPVVSVLLSALEAVRSGLESEHLFRFGKSLALGLAPDGVAALENYCYIWGITGRAWRKPLTGNPRGLADSFTEEDTQSLQALTGLKETLLTPILHLEEALARPTGRSFATALHALLLELDAPGNLARAAGEMEPEKAKSFLEEEAALWDEVMALLDIFGSVIGERALPLQRLIELFRLGVGTIDVGRIPQTLDQVILGMADRIRPDAPKATYVIGATEGEFPLQYSGGGVFTDAERQALIEGGLEIAEGAQVRAVREKYYAYFALTTPSHRLTVSYPRITLTGERKTPSVLFSDLKSLLPLPVVESTLAPAEERAVNLPTALDALSRLYHRDSPTRAALLTYAREAGGLPSLESLAAIGGPHRYRLRREEVSRGLFGERMCLSPSRVERYYSCPFAYFCQSGLRLHPRKKVEFSPLESGTVIHAVLQEMIARHGGRGLGACSDSQLRKEIREVIDGYLQKRLEGVTELPSRFRYLYTRLVGQLLKLLRQLALEFAQCEFEPKEFELEIEARGKIEPLYLTTPAGTQVFVEGTVDRVDVLEKGGRRYVRVVDYKSGSKTFQLSDIYYGLNMQMLIYLFSIWQNGREDLADALPAGVLYMPARSSYLSTDRGTPREELERERAKTYRMSGLILEDSQVVAGMERELQGIFIPAKQKADGSWDSASALANLARMGKLKERIEGNITKMAKSLLEGAVEALPVSGGDYHPCEYCDFAAVCGHEEGAPTRVVERMKNEALFQLLEQDGKEGA